MPSAPNSTAKDFFLHLLATITLYMSVFAVLRLLFSYINVLFPDALSFYYTGELDNIRFATAMLLVSYVVYLLIGRAINKDIAAQPEKADVAIRRWLVYLTIFLAALMILIDVIALLYNFLNGELSVRFYLKVFAVLVVALSVFGYYLWDIRVKAALHPKQTRTFAFTSLAAMLAVFVASFVIAGSPWYQRQVRFDTQRLNDLQTIQYQVVDYWQRKQSLPASTQDLKNSINGFVPPVDPETSKPYDYKSTGPMAFELCADFKTDSKDTQGPKNIPVPYPEPAAQQNWQHKTGHTCFERTIDPSLYPPMQKTAPGVPVPVR